MQGLPAFLLFALVFMGIFSMAEGQTLRDIDESIRNEENMLGNLQKDKQSAVKQLKSILKQIENYRKLSVTLNKEMDSNSKRIETIRANITEINKNIGKTKSDILKSNIYFIDNLGFSEITVVATAKNPSETIKTLEILSQAGTNLEADMKKQSLRVFELERLAIEEKVRLEEAKTLNLRQIDAIAKLETQNKKYKDTITLIKNDEAGRMEYVEMLKFQRQELDDELKRASNLVLKKKHNAGVPELISAPIPRGTMVWPVRGEVIEPFGETFMEDAGVTFFHKGIKIRPEKSTPVFASASGTVIFADYIRGFDNIIVVDHGSAFYTVYGNLNETRAEIDGKIERGDILGRINVDLTNNTSYLYFEIRKNEEALDPAGWLAGYKNR